LMPASLLLGYRALSPRQREQIAQREAIQEVLGKQSIMSRDRLIEMAREGLSHAQAGSIPQAAEVMTIPALKYYDFEHWRREMDQVFGRMPLMLATTAELKNPGDYKALMAGGVPVLISRTESGEIRAFVNSCAHRGSQIMPQGLGNAQRFTCPYHAWSYDHGGNLTAVYSAEDFGELDKSRYGLVPLKCLERAGLIWVLTDSRSDLDIETFLCGYDEQLAHFDFSSWHYFGSRRIDGPNWKIAYDGYLDFYHLPILHRETFGGDTSNKAMYYSWGPHQHVKSPQTTAMHLENTAEDEWPTAFLLSGVWTIFPHVSIASFGEEGESRGVLISQLFPGETVGESYTIQNYLMANEPTEEQAAAATEQFELLKYVVQEEDYATGLRQQESLRTGARDHILFGRNEEGGQLFHGWLQELLETENSELNALFKRHG
jgi:phenylpropionate dioxygenase-like ring-hydroxylating dioxygenase large terminal subunit